tara:strand:- start:2117 stop:4090 length:1974 start_codon:yes stop_codon:yes gene_type:complete
VATKNVNIDIIAKDKTAKAMQSATKGVNDLKNNVKNSVSAQTNSFNALGNTVRNVIGGVIVFQAFRFGQEMVNMASSVEEMRSKSSVVFGQFVNDVRSQLGQFGDNVGRSTHELESMASSIQDTFVPMGFARGEASKLAVELTKLAVDVASFNNASDTDTMMAFQSALVGNHETVRRFGVVITEATLKQELLRMGINKASKDVTNAEKVQARLNLIIAGTSDAHGDAERTSGSFANTSKALGSALSELSVDIMTPMLPKLTKMAEGFIDATETAREFFVFIGMLNRDLSTTALRQDRIAEIELKLSEIRSGLLTKIFGLNKVEKIHIQNLEAELGHLTKMPELQAMVLDQETLVIKSKEQLIKTREKENKLLEEKSRLEKIAKSDGTRLGIDASMGDVPTAFSNEEKLKGLQDLASLEMQIQQEAFANKFNKIQEQDDLLAEQQRIQADRTLKIAHETAMKEFKIRKELFDKNLQLIKSGNASEINLEKMTGKEMNALAKETGREALRELSKHNRTAFELNKAFAIKDAIISTAQGVSKALSMGPFGIPLAIAIGALGVAQVATIASTKYTGRRLGGRMNQGEPYMVGEAGPEMVVPDRPSNVVPNNKLGNGEPVTVNFNINTVDARGFNELLVNSRGTIVNLINTAMNEKGKMAIV